MAGLRKSWQRGSTIVEFSLFAPMFFVFLFGIIDFSRIIQANTTVAEAARQAARQGAANADTTPFPFSASPQSGTCAGTGFSDQANGDGCMTDARMVQTANSIMNAGALTGSLTLHADTDAAACRALSAPAAGTGLICLKPAEGAGAATASSCPATGTPGLTAEGNRETEWSNHLLKGCYLVQVTVIYTYQPYTALLQNLIGNRIVLVSSTTTIAEY
jgi:Flp pilus assembly protein TadG